MDDMTTMPQMGAPMGPRPRASGLAIASLILGLLALPSCGATGLIGLILGIVALSIISTSTEPLGGRGAAIWGIVLSAVGMVLSVVLVLSAILMPALVAARGQARSVAVMAQGKQLAMGMLMYADEHEGRLPDPKTWPNEIDAYAVNQAFDNQGRMVWAMNEALGGVRTGEIADPARTVLLFAVESGSAAAGGPELLADQPPTRYGYVVVFVDGHVERVLHPDAPDRLVWDPSGEGGGSGSVQY